ncbi:uncharacterized protein [Amphiura filiformis]|uniref:uncharacterized protein n=1 Tax=Amphiura filiformis TaxID=82378 RepID=UPI003B20F304
MAERVFLAKDVDNNPFIGQEAAVLVRNENNEHAGNLESRSSLKESRSHAAVHGDGNMEAGTMDIKKELTAERTALMNEPASSTTPLERTPVEGQYGCSFCHQVFSEMNDLLDHQKHNHIKRETQGGNLVTDTALSSRGETPPDRPNQDNILDYTTQGMTTCNHENEHSSLDTAISSNLTGASQRTAEHADNVASDTDDIAKATGINHTSHADKDNVAKIHVSKESHADNDVVPATDRDDVIQLSGVKHASCTDKVDNDRAPDSSKARHASLKDDTLKELSDGRHASYADEEDYGVASGTNHACRADDDNEATGTGANHALCVGKDDDVGEASEGNHTPDKQQIMKQEFVSPIKFMLHRNAPVCSTLNESAQAQNNELSELGAIQSLAST